MPLVITSVTDAINVSVASKVSRRRARAGASNTIVSKQLAVIATCPLGKLAEPIHGGVVCR